MTKISISNFSCIEEASIVVSPLTVLIGPQASGKSVISKLLYFFIKTIHSVLNDAENHKGFESFRVETEEMFCRWFPPSAWGSGKFSIRYEAGPIEIVVKRRRSRSALSEKVAVKFSDYLENFYHWMIDQVTELKARRERAKPDAARYSWEISYRAQTVGRNRLIKDLDGNFVEYQMFVPAGRSFFTSIGKAVAAFEHGGLLDPVTVQFGRLFAALRDHRTYVPEVPKEELQVRETLMQQLFGGAIKFERDTEYVEAQDGRRVPFSILSSGQQELLPLWLTLGNFDSSTPRARPDSGVSLVYIEEPEAHLFPTAQSLLLEYLASIVSAAKSNRRMLITTHSPYVLAKINNLILAGKFISRGKELSGEAAKIIPRRSWLRAKHTSAYAIVDRRVRDVMDDDGLIDGEYLDKVSGDISDEFLSLLDIRG